MGAAKRRGTFEERRQQVLRAEILKREEQRKLAWELMTSDQRTASIERHFKYYEEQRSAADTMYAIMRRFMT